MNGWQKILKEIYKRIKDTLPQKENINFKIGSENSSILCDVIGELLINADCLSYVRFIEEILDVKQF